MKIAEWCREMRSWTSEQRQKFIEALKTLESFETVKREFEEEGLFTLRTIAEEEERNFIDQEESFRKGATEADEASDAHDRANDEAMKRNVEDAEGREHDEPYDTPSLQDKRPDLFRPNGTRRSDY